MHPAGQEFSQLKRSAHSIIEGLFKRTYILPAGPGTGDPQLDSEFRAATDLFKSGAFAESKERYLSVSRQAEAIRPGRGFMALLNAAACAAATNQWAEVIELLSPRYRSGYLYGHPLWNLALGFHRTGRAADTIQAVEAWATKAQEEQQRAKGFLLLAALQQMHGDEAASRAALQKAMESDRAFVSGQLGATPHAAVPHAAVPAMRPSPPPGTILTSPSRPAMAAAAPQGRKTISPEVKNRLRALIEPRRPERRPELSLQLPPDDLEVFASSIEDVAESRLDKAKASLAELQKKYPNVRHIDYALGACELFLGNVEKAKGILLAAVESDARPPGNALWNLACAEILSDDPEGAIKALNKCAETEYRTKSQLWMAVGVLTEAGIGGAGRMPAPTPAPQQTVSVAPAGPKSLTEHRVEYLNKFLKPRRIPTAYKPDLGKLTVRDRTTVEQILKDARQAEPANAYTMLLPWVSRYPEVYTLKVHAAAFALMANDLPAAMRQLNQAQELRALDGVSRMNQAYICLRNSDFAGVARALEGGENYQMAESHEYWLALSLARELSSSGDAAAAAARAVHLAVAPPARASAQTTLAECGITPSVYSPSENPTVTAARQALERLDHGDAAGAADLLNGACGEQFERVAEVGPRVFEPQFERRPYRRLSGRMEQAFQQAVRSYEDGSYHDAAEDFLKIYDESRNGSAVNNHLAALLKADERGRALRIARRILSARRRQHWKLVYNFALLLQNDRYRVSELERRPGGDMEMRIAALIAAVCRIGYQTSPGLWKNLEYALNRLRESAGQPSPELMLALAWTELCGQQPRLDRAAQFIRQALDNVNVQNLVPPAEASTVAQLRAAYQQLREGGRPDDAIQYLNRIVEAKEEERSQSNPRQIERGIGIELNARCLLASEYHQRGNTNLAIDQLEHCDVLLNTNRELISLGFLSRDWAELSKLSLELGMPYAALRRVEASLAADPGSTAARDLKEKIEAGLPAGEAPLLDRSLGRVVEAAEAPGDRLEVLRAAAKALSTCDLVHLRAPLTIRALNSLLNSIEAQGDGDVDTEERAEAVAVLARAELPQDGIGKLERVLTWVAKTFAKEQLKNPVDIELSEDKLWIRAHENEARGLLIVSAAGGEACKVSIQSQDTGRTIWQGEVQPGKPQFVRSTLEREEGFEARAQVDIPLRVKVLGPPGAEFPLTLTANVSAADEAVWPDYPTGALDPKELSGELYGRGGLIRRMVSQFGPTRAKETYLIEGVRQMGKTSLLKFVRREAPKHVLPVYINLEAIQADSEKNIWNCIVEQILREESVSAVLPPPAGRIQGMTHNDLVLLARDLCAKLGRSYLLLLMDELHVLLKESPNPKGVLAELRSDLNDPANKISVVLADRYTLQESEKKVDSEYWLQLSPVPLGPLDPESSRSAIDIPCAGTDTKFLPEAIDRIYHWTFGYPFHVQRLVQNVIASNLDGPWLAVIASDVEKVVPRLVAQDRLFQEGLCRRDRMDDTMQAAIAAAMEWADARELFPQLSDDDGWHQMLSSWEPRLDDLLQGLGDPTEILGRLVTIGVMRKEGPRHVFFSPLLEQWLRKMRDESRSLVADRILTSDWGLYPSDEAGRLSGNDWMRLDSDLAARCNRASTNPPLKLKAHNPDDWNTLVREAGSRTEFEAFLKAAFDLFVDGREEKRTMLKYPWLTLAYHRLRLVRNVFAHGNPSAVSQRAWDQVFARATGLKRSGGEPATPEQWRAVQLAILRGFNLGFRNALAIVGGAQATVGSGR